MPEYTKINFNYRKEISDWSDLVEMLFPSNRNQQHAAACILIELKRADYLVSNLGYLEKQHDISRRILQRTRAKLTRLGLIEHISSFNMRYGGQAGWKLSSKFEGSLKRLAEKCSKLRDTQTNSKEKDTMLIDLADARRNIGKEQNVQKTRVVFLEK